MLERSFMLLVAQEHDDVQECFDAPRAVVEALEGAAPAYAGTAVGMD